jgi:hypothetical protein
LYFAAKSKLEEVSNYNFGDLDEDMVVPSSFSLVGLSQGTVFGERRMMSSNSFSG